MKTFLLNMATAMLIVGYVIHAINFAVLQNTNMCTAMFLFAAAMYFLFI